MQEEDQKYESGVIIALSRKARGLDEITKQIREIGYEIRSDFHNPENDGIFEVGVPAGKEDEAIEELKKYDFGAMRKISKGYFDDISDEFTEKGCCGFGCGLDCGKKRKGCF